MMRKMVVLSEVFGYAEILEKGVFSLYHSFFFFSRQLFPSKNHSRPKINFKVLNRR